MRSCSRCMGLVVLAVLTGVPLPVNAAGLPVVESVEHQPLVAATRRLVDALEYAGAPLSKTDNAALKAALANPKQAESIRTIQAILDRHCLVGVHINPESRVKVAEGPVRKQLVQQGWRTFLVKVHNEAGVTAPLVANSPQALPVYMRGRGSRQRPQAKAKLVAPADVGQRFLDLAMFSRQPLKPTLSGLELEYRILHLYSRDVGRREAKLTFHVGQGTQDLGFRSEVPVLFECVPAVEISLDVQDFDGRPTMAAFVIRDGQGRVYPNPARRLAPDFFFHNQVYRAGGESIHLPPGVYSVEISRGPEYRVDMHRLVVPAGVVSHKAAFRLSRWIHPAARRWYSGDHHVHAAGCSHYDSPTEGVTPADMMRHILGEDLNVGCVLSWGPCWYTQKQYFEGRTSALSKPRYLMRYDVEVSGFPSSHAGHLCLLRLSEDDYPGTKLIEEWPSWTLPVLDWGKQQGGVVGYSHSGWGLALPDYSADGKREFINRGKVPAGWTGRAADTLPDYAMPRFDGIGANEYIVTVAHDVCDFISTVDTPAVWELNIWYHTLNCGYRTRISGETDFPCIYGDKVGLGRIYVKLDKDQPLDFDNWINGVRDGRSYCGDGRSHVMDFRVEGVSVGEPGSGGVISQLDLDRPDEVTIKFDVAAWLEPKPTEATQAIRGRRLDQKPYWHIERGRIGETRRVPVELVVNGYPVARKKVKADGKTRSMKFDVDIKHSSWIAVRIFPSVHTNPVFVRVDKKPIRASRRSATWCRQAVDVCWNQKKGRIRDDDQAAAKAAYDKARAIYEAIIDQSVAD
ncbi:MAG: hypothetical protein CMJ65_02675 [Planctomycetaceae bacterium]|nr:hypothetical protein [Planctomycetaceae bacterium]